MESYPQMKYSVIIPFFNSKDHMQHCIYFVNGCKRDDVEFIFINDCSSDNSEDFLEQSISINNLKILHTDVNGGPGVARNIGLQNAEGQWIVFLDSDDSLNPNFFDVIDEASNNNLFDIIIYDAIVFSSKSKYSKLKKSMYGSFKGEINNHDLIVNGIGGIRKCFKKSLLQNRIFFPPFRNGEDFSFYFLLISNNPSCKCFYIDKPLYNIYQRPNSLSRGAVKENVMPTIFEYLSNNCVGVYRNDLKKLSIRLFLYGGTLQMLFYGFSRKEICLYINNYEKNYNNWYKDSKKLPLNKPKAIFLFFIKKRLYLCMKLSSYLHRFLTTR